MTMTMTMTAAPWRPRAACRGSAPVDGATTAHRWFPVRGGDNGSAAKATCRSCPVRADCLLDAVESNDQHGVRGGVADPDRRGLRRAWVADGREPGPQYRLAESRVFLRLDDPVAQSVPDRNGAGAAHGRASSHGRGCRCDWCRLDKAAMAPAPISKAKGWAA